MPTASLPSKVLVSGASGFVATWVVYTLLERGFAVRGTVRAENKGEHLRTLFIDEVASGRLELVVVPDIVAPGAFDDAVKGVDAIEHTASPVDMTADDPNELIEPAVKGTVRMLESALKYAGPQLKRIVVTSSCAAIRNPSGTGLFDGNNWNEESIVEVREKGKAASQFGKYRASKSLAEKAAWDFVTNNASTISWDLVTICPSYIFGPVLHDVPTPSKLNDSTAIFYNALFSNPTSMSTKGQGGWVDVRDVAEGHVRALEVPEAGGQRFILSAEAFIWQDWFDAVNALEFPGLNIPAGAPDTGEAAKYDVRYDSTKAHTVLGVKLRNKLTTARDVIEDFRTRGWGISTIVEAGFSSSS